MKAIKLILLLLITQFYIGNAQIPDLALPNMGIANLEIEALEPSIYLIGQEYIVSRNGKKLGRGGNDFFGKLYGIGVLVDNNLWFPAYLKTPWRYDENFKEYEKTHKAECSTMGIKAMDDTITTSFMLKKKKSSDILTFLVMSKNGVAINTDPKKEGTLIVYHMPKESINIANDLSFSTINYNDLMWQDGFCQIKKPYFGERMILGGVLYTRHVSVGKIEWKAAALMVKSPDGENWELKTLVVEE